jgi:hypothetical protein
VGGHEGDAVALGATPMGKRSTADVDKVALILAGVRDRNLPHTALGLNVLLTNCTFSPSIS